MQNSLQWGYDGWGGHIMVSTEHPYISLSCPRINALCASTKGTGLIHVNPKLNKSEAQISMQPAIDFAISQGGSGLIDELPSWYAFFTKYVVTAEAVCRVASFVRRECHIKLTYTGCWS